jgi:hypothetical protein
MPVADFSDHRHWLSNLSLLGDQVTVNLVVVVAEPPVVVTVIVPVFAPVGTLSFSFAAVSFVKVVELTVTFLPLNVTLVAFSRFVPLMVIVVPTAPDVGVKLVIVGTA